MSAAMKPKLILIICLFISLTRSYSRAEGAFTFFAFYETDAESEVIDSIQAHYSPEGMPDNLEVRLIEVQDGRFHEAAASFEHHIDSLHCISSDLKYAIIGSGISGSAAAILSASGTNPTMLLLISAPCIAGKDILTRLFCAQTYLLNTPEIRQQINADIRNQSNPSLTSGEFKEMLVYEPSEYLQAIKCPVYAVFGTDDVLIEWYSNCTGLEEALPQTRENVIRAYPGTGYCLKENGSIQYNIPMIGDRKPDEGSTLNSEAIDDLVGWIKAQQTIGFKTKNTK